MALLIAWLDDIRLERTRFGVIDGVKELDLPDP